MTIVMINLVPILFFSGGNGGAGRGYLFALYKILIAASLDHRLCNLFDLVNVESYASRGCTFIYKHVTNLKNVCVRQSAYNFERFVTSKFDRYALNANVFSPNCSYLGRFFVRSKFNMKHVINIIVWTACGQNAEAKLFHAQYATNGKSWHNYCESWALKIHCTSSNKDLIRFICQRNCKHIPIRSYFFFYCFLRRHCGGPTSKKDDKKASHVTISKRLGGMLA